MDAGSTPDLIVATADRLRSAGISIYYQDESTLILNSDCRDILPQLGQVDHVITDPPYEAEAHTNARRSTTAKHAIVDLVIDFAAIDEQTRWMLCQESKRLARGWILIFCQVEAVAAWRSGLTAANARYLRAQAWVKPDGAPQFTGDRPAVGFECIVTAWAGDSRSKWNGGGRRGVYEHCVNSFGRLTNGRPHPTMKPEALMRELVTLFSDPGDTILDPFGGSGTTAVAAKRLGRKCILVERDERHCETSAKRLAQGALDLFGEATA